MQTSKGRSGRQLLGCWAIAVGLLTGNLNAAPASEKLDPAQSRTVWQSLVRVRVQVPEKQELASNAVQRFLSTALGRTLLAELPGLLPPATGSESPIIVHFVDALPVNADDYDGYVRPIRPDASQYEVFVWNYPARQDDSGEILYGQYPGNSLCDIVFWYQEPESMMAHTIYHELLHIWFINRYAGEIREYPTGHGNLTRCELDEEFMDMLREHARELGKLEGRLPEPIDDDFRPTER